MTTLSITYIANLIFTLWSFILKHFPVTLFVKCETTDLNHARLHFWNLCSDIELTPDNTDKRTSQSWLFRVSDPNECDPIPITSFLYTICGIWWWTFGCLNNVVIRELSFDLGVLRPRLLRPRLLRVRVLSHTESLVTLNKLVTYDYLELLSVMLTFVRFTRHTVYFLKNHAEWLLGILRVRCHAGSVEPWHCIINRSLVRFNGRDGTSSVKQNSNIHGYSFLG